MKKACFFYSLLFGCLLITGTNSSFANEGHFKARGERREKRPMPKKQNGEGAQNNIRLRVNKLLEQIKTKEPQEYERLMQLRKTNREQYFKEIRKKMPEGPSEKRREIDQLDQKCRKLAERYKATNDEKEKEIIKKELEQTIEASMNLLIEDTRERVERIQNFLQNFQKNYQEIKDERLADLLSE